MFKKHKVCLVPNSDLKINMYFIKLEQEYIFVSYKIYEFTKNNHDNISRTYNID